MQVTLSQLRHLVRESVKRTLTEMHPSFRSRIPHEVEATMEVDRWVMPDGSFAPEELAAEDSEHVVLEVDLYASYTPGEAGYGQYGPPEKAYPGHEADVDDVEAKYNGQPFQLTPQEMEHAVEKLHEKIAADAEIGDEDMDFRD